MVKKKAFWDKKNPKKKSTPLTPAQKAKAKAMAKKWTPLSKSSRQRKSKEKVNKGRGQWNKRQ
jgi:hypothetical protein